MDTLLPSKKPHSAEYFGDYRDFWWNHDFLELMAERLELTKINQALDIGCGVGHWGQILSSVMSPNSQFVGIDREEEWVVKATQRAKEMGLESRFVYKQGDVNRLPFADATFDLVTCQTVLIHIAEPKKALSEMLRVLKPRGLILSVEPNNLMQHSVMSSLSQTESKENITEMFRFKITCERGKEALGLGNISIGDLLPGYFSELNMTDIKVYISDKAVPLFPPYETREQQVNLQQALEWKRNEFWTWDKEETRKYFLAGGGNEHDFAHLWKNATFDDGSFAKAVRDNLYHSAGGCLMYLVSGRRK